MNMRNISAELIASNIEVTAFRALRSIRAMRKAMKKNEQPIFNSLNIAEYPLKNNAYFISLASTLFVYSCAHGYLIHQTNICLSRLYQVLGNTLFFLLAPCEIATLVR